MTGQKKSFQAVMNVSIPSTAMPGRAIGSTMLHTVRSDVAPSTRAASISSSGSDCIRYCRMKNTPKAVTSDGRITDGSVPASPRSAMIEYSGTTDRLGGIIIVPIVIAEQDVAAAERILAKA